MLILALSACCRTQHTVARARVTAAVEHGMLCNGSRRSLLLPAGQLLHGPWVRCSSCSWWCQVVLNVAAGLLVYCKGSASLQQLCVAILEQAYDMGASLSHVSLTSYLLYVNAWWCLPGCVCAVEVDDSTFLDLMEGGEMMMESSEEEEK